MAIIVVVAAIVALGGFLAYSVYSNSAMLKKASPASREIDAFVERLKKNPNDLDTRMRLAQALAVAGRNTEAIEQYKQVIKVNKKFVPALSGLGFELLKQKKWSEGEQYFKRVITLTEATTPEGSSGSSSLEIAYYYTGIALMEQKDYTSAVGYLKKALRMRRDASDTSYALSVCYDKLDVVDGQKQMLEYTLQFDPSMPEANYDYGLLLLAEKDEAGAAEAFRISTDGAPYKEEPRDALDKFGTASARIAKAEELSNDPKAALVHARVASALAPRNTEALLLTAKIYEDLKNNEDAAAAYRRVLAIEPDHAEATAGLKRVQDGS